MNATRSRLLGAFLLCAAIAVGWPAISEFMTIDTCLDAGGSLNYVRGSCDLQQSQSNPISLGRVPWRIICSASLGVAGLRVLLRRKRFRE